MQKKYLFSTVLLTIVFQIGLTAQNKFSNCSAAFLNNKMIVDDYSPNGKSVVNSTSEGQLTVCTATFDNNKWSATEKVGFKITIRDEKTKTLWSYSDVTFKEIDIKKVLSKCQKGDHILLSVVKNEYALPHNEILVE